MDTITIGKQTAAPATAEKSLLDYINEFDMTPPEYGYSFLVIDKNLNTNANIISETFTLPTTTGFLTVKKYDKENNITLNINFGSGTDFIAYCKTSDGVETPYGIITKYSVEPKDITKPITALTFASKNSLLFIEFGQYAFDALITAFKMFFQCYSLKKGAILPDSWGSITTVASMFSNCNSMTIPPTLPTSWGSITIVESMFNGCNSMSIPPTLPDSWGSITTVVSMFNGCYSMSIPPTLPDSWGSITTVASMFRGCHSMTIPPTLPTSWGSITTVAVMFNNCYSMSIPPTLPTSWGSITTVESMFSNCYSMDGIMTMPTDFGAITTFTEFSTNDYILDAITNFTQSQNIQVNAGYSTVKNYALQSISFMFKVSAIGIYGAADLLSAIASIDIDYANSTYGGSSPQIDFRYNSLDTTELDRILTALPIVTGKTINIVGNPGAATCDATIGTAKGWTVTVA